MATRVERGVNLSFSIPAFTEEAKSMCQLSLIVPLRSRDTCESRKRRWHVFYAKFEAWRRSFTHYCCIHAEAFVFQPLVEVCVLVPDWYVNPRMIEDFCMAPRSHSG